ncbi:hypothetical protein B566_EDAN008786 [Ephemera danica]|nr:hypothetical protein B566_EDAN008786 [Ephemera danica]
MATQVLSILLLMAMVLCMGSARPSDQVDQVPEDFEFPIPRHRGFFGPGYSAETISTRIASWSPLERNNVWELSGLHEGDIMQDNRPGPAGRNAMRDPESLWTDATIPYILEPTFLDSERKIIREGMDMIQKSTCFKFRPFKIGDMDFVLVQGAPTGCWSYVGKRGGGQVLNLQRGGCVHKGRENNFAKYNDTVVTDYDIGYDYGSVMHYSRKAFSKNGEDTIVPLEDGAEIGNREKVSDKDLAKLRAKYGCDENPDPEADNSLLGLLGNMGSSLVERL